MEVEMDATYHRLTDLFSQIGLSSDAGGIQLFLDINSPLNNSIRLEEAPFWTISQSSFLREKILQDADWALVIDQLNVALRSLPLSNSAHSRNTQP
jgi:hypothetical protein